jgi:uncharacterized cupredoxin-like copper-binding protein
MKVVVSVVLALALASFGSAAVARQSPSLRADVAEWSIVPSTGVVPAGRVRIDVHNLGAASHRIVLVRTDRFDQPLALKGAHAVVRPLATSALLAPAARATITANLKPGSYLLLDNLPWHYWAGTSVAFTVR